MVGVPGKSKGCTTCRRRKIRCDLKEPSCERCTKSGRTCEGYARYPVFLNRTISGPEKRHGLEEVKTLIAPRTELEALNALSIPLSTINYQRYLEETNKVVFNRVPLQPSNASVVDAQLISAFYECYIPVHASAQGGPACKWLQQAISHPSPGQALQLSLKALALTRLGSIRGENDMSLRGSVVYGRALQEVQKALWSERVMWQDEILAAGYILSIYEFFESTSESIGGWNSHISGLAHLVLMRGANRHCSPFSLAILEEFRTSSMAQCIQYRVKSFLGSEEWQTQPWDLVAKDVFQRLYDKGFALAALFETMDKENVLTRPDKDIPMLSSWLQRYSDLDADFDAWFEELHAEAAPSPLYWVEPDRNRPYHPEVPHNKSQASFVFPTFRLANATVNFWGLKTIISGSIALLCGTVLSLHGEQRTPEGTQQYYELRSTAKRLIAQHGSPYRLELAINIMRSMPYCMNDSMGLIGPQKSLLGLRIALFSLRRQPGEELKWCQNLYQQLVSKSGLGYAREIAKVDGKYSTAVASDKLPSRLSVDHGDESPGNPSRTMEP